MASDIHREVDPTSSVINYEDRYIEYKEIDLFRRILASLLQAPKSGSATELVERFRTFIIDDAIALKKAKMFERVEATMSAASLLKHVLECEECKSRQDVCARLEAMKPLVVGDYGSETEEAHSSRVTPALGKYASQQSIIPTQRDSRDD